MMAQIHLQLVTWNIGSKSRKQRYPVIREFNAKCEHDIGFLQEIGLIEENAEKKCEFSQGKEYHYSQCSTSVYHAAIHVRKEIDGKSVTPEPPLTSESIASKCVPKRAPNTPQLAVRRAGFDESLDVDMIERRLMRSGITSRLHAVRLTIEDMASVIVVSFHSIRNRDGRGRADDQELQTYINLFFNLMCRLAQIENCSVIIGGDFNLEIQKWKEDVEQAFLGKVYVANVYQPAKDRDSIIDTFAVVYPKSKAAASVICELSLPTPDEKKEGFDHGLVTVSCTLIPGLHPLADKLQLPTLNKKRIHSNIDYLNAMYYQTSDTETELQAWQRADIAIKLINWLYIHLSGRKHDQINSILQHMYWSCEEHMRVIEGKLIDELSESKEVRSDMDFAHTMHMRCQKPLYKECAKCGSDHIVRLCHYLRTKKEKQDIHVIASLDIILNSMFSSLLGIQLSG